MESSCGSSSKAQSRNIRLEEQNKNYRHN
ncbi:unnamed protein product, partial [Rotaria sordida]